MLLAYHFPTELYGFPCSNHLLPISWTANYYIKSPSPDVFQVIVDIAAGVFDVDGHVGRLQHIHGELTGEGGDK